MAAVQYCMTGRVSVDVCRAGTGCALSQARTSCFAVMAKLTRNPCPEETASALSRTLFLWNDELIRLGYERTRRRLSLWCKYMICVLASVLNQTYQALRACHIC